MLSYIYCYLHIRFSVSVFIPHICLFVYMYIGKYICDGSTLGVCTGTLDELAGSHTRLAIYPTLTIHYQRVVICALLDTRFKGRR